MGNKKAHAVVEETVKWIIYIALGAAVAYAIYSVVSKAIN